MASLPFFQGFPVSVLQIFRAACRAFEFVANLLILVHCLLWQYSSQPVLLQEAPKGGDYFYKHVQHFGEITKIVFVLSSPPAYRMPVSAGVRIEASF